jgi:membrane peptidoglycan carboxypeptidase
MALREGKGHFKGKLSFEVERYPSPQLKVHNSCKFDCSAEPIRDLKDGQIAYQAYDKSNKLFTRVIGPSVGSWTYLASLPSQVVTAFVTLEDPGFYSHSGVISQALENSFKDNLRLGKFFRGGSTISMQLVKNLWLTRSKTIGRKAHEVLLTSALESCLTKAEILEDYLNVVEFGPDLYGIGAASRSYFEHGAEQLEPIEAFYLASILPSPRKAIPPKSGGLERTKSLMVTLAKRGFISDAFVPLTGEVNAEEWATE